MAKHPSDRAERSQQPSHQEPQKSGRLAHGRKEDSPEGRGAGVGHAATDRDDNHSTPEGDGVGGREGWLLLVHGWGGFLEESTEIASSDHYAQLPKSGALLSHRENCVCPALDTV